jgi:hypothetical protein
MIYNGQKRSDRDKKYIRNTGVESWFRDVW